MELIFKPEYGQLNGILISNMGIMGHVLCCWHASVWEFNVGDICKLKTV